LTVDEIRFREREGTHATGRVRRYRRIEWDAVLF